MRGQLELSTGLRWASSGVSLATVPMFAGHVRIELGELETCVGAVRTSVLSYVYRGSNGINAWLADAQTNLVDEPPPAALEARRVPTGTRTRSSKVGLGAHRSWTFRVICGRVDGPVDPSAKEKGPLERPILCLILGPRRVLPVARKRCFLAVRKRVETMRLSRVIHRGDRPCL